MATCKIKAPGRPAQFLTIGLALALMVYPMNTRAHSRESDVFYPGSDPQSGATGGCWFHYDDSGVVAYANCYAGTWAWQSSAWWSITGGWTFGSVVITDPNAEDSTLVSRSISRSIGGSRALERGDPDFNDPSFDPPVTSPSKPFQPETCQDCINRLRNDCKQTAGTTTATWAAGASGFIITCVPAAVPGIPLTLGGDEVACFVTALGILGTGYWQAKVAQRQCNNQAPISCSDPATGKPCYQLGYK